MQVVARWLRFALEMFGGLLLVLLTVLVSIAAAIRFFGGGFAWYDEVAPILLTWVTYFGAALVDAQPRPSRLRQYRPQLAVPACGRRPSPCPKASPLFFSGAGLGRFPPAVGDQRRAADDGGLVSERRGAMRHPDCFLAFVAAELVTCRWRGRGSPYPVRRSKSPSHLS